MQYGPFDWLDADMADAARMYVERGRFTYAKYVSDWSTKFLYKMGWKLDGRYTAMAKEDREKMLQGRQAAARSQAIHIAKMRPHYVPDRSVVRSVPPSHADAEFRYSEGASRGCAGSSGI